jgi:predicted ATPase
MKHAKDFLEYVFFTYGKSVYQIELEVACAAFVADHGKGQTRQDAAEGAAKRAWEDAGIFIESMKRNYEARQRSP